MPLLFGIDLAQELADAMPAGDDGVPAATLTVRTPGTRDSNEPSAGTNPTSTSYECRGWISKYAGQVEGTMVKRTASEVVLLGKSIGGGTVTPAPGHRVSIDGTAYQIVGVATDPAGATYTLTVKA